MSLTLLFGLIMWVVGILTGVELAVWWCERREDL